MCLMVQTTVWSTSGCVERLDLVSHNPAPWDQYQAFIRETSNEGLDVRSSSGRGGQTNTGALDADPEVDLASQRGCLDREYQGDTANLNLKKDMGDMGGQRGCIQHRRNWDMVGRVLCLLKKGCILHAVKGSVFKCRTELIQILRVERLVQYSATQR